MQYSSYKSRRIVSSFLGGEIYFFADGFDSSFMLRYDSEKMLGRKILQRMLTDSESLIDVILK